MCCIYYASVFWLPHPSGQSSAEVLLAWCGECVIPGLKVLILTKCGLFCLWNESCHHLHWNLVPVELSVWKTWRGQVFLVAFWGRSSPCWEWSKLDWERQFYQRSGREGLDVKKANRLFGAGAYCRWLCVNVSEEGGMELPASSSVPQEPSQ